MKYWLIISIIALGSFSGKEKLPKAFSIQQSQVMEIKGFPGETINSCIEKRIKGQDVDHLIEPFKLKNETSCWQSEFWGKWMLSAVGAYKITKDPELLEKMKYAAEGLLATQLKDGYIGNYGPDTQLTGWDIWGRKYSMLGLIKYYEISTDKRAMNAAAKVADFCAISQRTGNEVPRRQYPESLPAQ